MLRKGAQHDAPELATTRYIWYADDRVAYRLSRITKTPRGLALETPDAKSELREARHDDTYRYVRVGAGEVSSELATWSGCDGSEWWLIGLSTIPRRGARGLHRFAARHAGAVCYNNAVDGGLHHVKV